MMTRWVRTPAILGLCLGSSLMVSVLGCGGQATDSSDAVVVPDSTVSLAPAGRPSPTAAPGSNAPSAAAEPSAGTATSAPVKAEGFGTLKGQVTFVGDPPAPKVLFEKGKAAKDPEVCGKDAPLISERLLVEGGTKGVKNALVYLSKPTSVSDEAKKAAAAVHVLFDQNKCVFEPHVLGILNGSQITLKSSDPVNHNINAKLKQSSFNQLLGPQSTNQFTPSGPERTPAEVTCDIHPWMKAWWMVFDHPYFAVTDGKGYFEIKNAPAGSQKVVVWQEAVDKNGFVTAPSGDAVVIKANDSLVQDFKIEPSRLRAE
jgi:plastocyanin